MNIASIAPTTTVNEELVGQLEELLGRARKGELVAAVVCGELTGRETFSAMSGDFDVFRMLGALEFAKARVLAQVEPD
jgi:hypothetical protein